MGIFNNQNFVVKKPFVDVSKSVYEVDVMPVDFTNAQNAVGVINKYVSGLTRGRISKFVSPG